MNEKEYEPISPVTVRLLNKASPWAFVTALVVPLKVPPGPDAIAAAMVTPEFATIFPLPSLSPIVKVFSGAAIVPLVGCGVWTYNCVAAPAVAVAEKVKGLPVSAGWVVAVSVLAPAVLPSVHEPTVAIPDAFVVALAPVIDPPPLATANVTATPAFALPLASVTSATTG